MRNFKNNHRRNRFRKNGSKQIHQKDNGHKSMADFSTNFNYRPRNQWKNNQNASKLIEKYTSLAREALSNGDKILSESYFQHADHFVRILSQKEIIKDNASNEKGKIQKEELEEIKEQSLTDN
tara:strand:+ start:274 stop:642 length:369 start_codon:yes stop_codon:yes gene_type:complete